MLSARNHFLYFQYSDTWSKGVEKANIQFDYNISFITVVLVAKYILSNGDLHPRGSKSQNTETRNKKHKRKQTDTGFHIILQYKKFNYNISFLSLVYVWKPLFLCSSYNLAKYLIWLQYLIQKQSIPDLRAMKISILDVIIPNSSLATADLFQIMHTCI
jgi:hypothetical protein